MANELEIQLDPFSQTGLTLLGKVFLNGVQQGADVSMTEVGGRAFYTGNYTLSGLSDGVYTVSFETVDRQYGDGELYVRNGAEVTLDQLLKAFEYTAPDNSSITDILSDTNELQTNQGNWLTATGFATPADVTASQTAIQNDIGNLNNITVVDIRNELATELGRIDVAISTRLDTAGYNAAPTEAEMYFYFTDLNREDAFKAIGFATPDTITAAKDEIIGEIDDLEAATPTVSAIRAEIERSGGMLDGLPTLTEMVNSSLAKDYNVTGSTSTITTAIGNLNDINTTQVRAEIDASFVAYDAPTKTELDAAESNIITEVQGVTLNNAAGIYTYFTDASREDAFKATGFATPANVTSARDDMQADIAALNNLSSADVTAAVPTVSEIANQIERPGGVVDGLPTLAQQEASLAQKSDVTSAKNEINTNIAGVPDAVLDEVVS